MLENPKLVLWEIVMGQDPDEMPQNATFHQGLHFLMRSKQSSGTEMLHNLEILICDPFKYIMEKLILGLDKQFFSIKL